MNRNPASHPVERDVLEAVDGERRTVDAVTIDRGQTFITYHSSHCSDDHAKTASLQAWQRWVTDHDARLIPERAQER
jgi:hypothetical protein